MLFFGVTAGSIYKGIKILISQLHAVLLHIPTRPVIGTSQTAAIVKLGLYSFFKFYSYYITRESLLCLG